MSDIVYCKDCVYAEPNNLDAYHAVKFGVFCTRYKQNTIGIHGCDNGKPKPQTNAERIRNMEDDELAIWLCENIKVCSECIAEGFCKPTGEQANGMLEWLKQEAKT